MDSSNVADSNISWASNTLLGQQSSSPDSSNASNHLSSPSLRASVRQRNENLGDRREQRPVAFHGGNTSGLGDDANQLSASLQITTPIERSVSTQGGSSVSMPRLSLGRIKESNGPLKRKRATPTRPFQRSQQLGQRNNLGSFERIAAIEAILSISPQSSKDADDLRRLQLAAAIHRNVKTSLARRQFEHQKPLPQLDPVLDTGDLGLGQLTVIKSRESCSFCIFESSYGSSDASILLPSSASCHRCLDCQPTRLFDEMYKDVELKQTLPLVPSAEKANSIQLGSQNTPTYRICIKHVLGFFFTIKVKLSDTILEVKSNLSEHGEIDWNFHHLISGGAVLQNNRPLSQYRITQKSLIEIVQLKRFNGADVTQYWKPLFCSNCPWTQVDVKLAKLCMACAEEKFAIITHSRHCTWTPFIASTGAFDGNPSPGRKHGNCMICTNMAEMKCAGCPLLVCVNCSAHLDNKHKGSLNGLIYSFSQEHIRNDVFLLRSDGGGF